MGYLQTCSKAHIGVLRLNLDGFLGSYEEHVGTSEQVGVWVLGTQGYSVGVRAHTAGIGLCEAGA